MNLSHAIWLQKYSPSVAKEFFVPLVVKLGPSMHLRLASCVLAYLEQVMQASGSLLYNLRVPSLGSRCGVAKAARDASRNRAQLFCRSVAKRPDSRASRVPGELAVQCTVSSGIRTWRRDRILSGSEARTLLSDFPNDRWQSVDSEGYCGELRRLAELVKLLGASRSPSSTLNRKTTGGNWMMFNCLLLRRRFRSLRKKFC